MTIQGLLSAVLASWQIVFGLLGLAVCHFSVANTAAADFPFLQPQFENIGDADEIPFGIVTALAQDQRGLIWIGTQKGLVRFDGYRYRVFRHTANDPHSMAGDYVYALCVAKDGRIWVGTNSDGVSVFDPASERFSHFRHDAKQATSLSSGPIFALLEDAQSNMWLATNHGLDFLAHRSTQFVHFRPDAQRPDSLLHQQVRSLALDQQQQLWVGSARGLQRYQADKKNFVTVDLSNNVPVPGAVEVRSLFAASDGKLWLGTTKQGAAWLQTNGKRDEKHQNNIAVHWLPLQEKSTTQQNGLSHAWISSILQVGDEVWLATNGGGINVVARDTGRVLQQVQHDPAFATSLAFDSVKPLLLDRAGLLWVGTWGGGLQRYNSKNKMVRLLRHGTIKQHGLSHPSVFSVLELANGQIAVGTAANGIDIIDRQHGLVDAYRYTDGKPGSLLDPIILALAETPDGSLWVGTQQNGVLRKAVNSRQWQVIPGLPGQQINRFLYSRDGSLWAATNKGLARIKSQAGQVWDTQFTSVPDKHGQAMQSYVVMMVEDAQGRIWAASHHGLWVLEPNSQGLHGIHADQRMASNLHSDDINSLLIDQQKRLWVSTGKGLALMQSWDGEKATFSHISTWLGPEYGVMSGKLQEDNAGRIWSGTAVFDYERTHLHVLSKADGISIGANWVGAYTRTRDGLLLQGGPLGLAIINPKHFIPWDDAPPLVVSELKIDGNSTPLGHLAHVKNSATEKSDSLLLQPHQRNFAIEFAALDFSEPRKNRYLYRLQGYETRWIETDAEHRRAAYGNLWPGTYTLQVRATNRVGAWSPHELDIPIVVLPAFWQTWYFIVLSVLLVLLSTFALYRWRTLRLKRLVAARTSDILQLGKIGQELTATLDPELAFARVHQQVRIRLDAHAFRIGIYEEAQQHIRFVYEFEADRRLPSSLQSMAEELRPAVWCVREKRELIVSNYRDLLLYMSEILPPKSGGVMQSIVYIPLMLETKVIGCLSVQSPQQNAYDKGKIEFLRILASYVVIAIANTTAHGKLSAAHDALAQAHIELDSSLRHLQETQQQMLLQEKMAGLGTLTAGVAHEMNNPTNFIHVAAQNLCVDIEEFQAFVQELIDEEGASDILPAFEERFQKLNRHVTTMLNGTERIKAIVKDLRAFTRLDEADKKIVQLSDCLLSTLNLVRTSWQEKVEFVTDFKDDPAIECWPALLNQVWMNLFVNACQAIEEKQHKQAVLGKLSIRLEQRPAEQAIAIIFTDNGIGMSKQVAAHAIEPFYTTKAVGSGTGLGLSIAFGIVQKHGGNLSFTSEEGVGSEFVVLLPMQRA